MLGVFIFVGNAIIFFTSRISIMQPCYIYIYIYIYICVCVCVCDITHKYICKIFDCRISLFLAEHCTSQTANSSIKNFACYCFEVFCVSVSSHQRKITDQSRWSAGACVPFLTIQHGNEDRRRALSVMFPGTTKSTGRRSESKATETLWLSQPTWVS